ncbi:hypothetical protein ACFQS1_08095 [Paractinoplanes rhizophilus]|uniref:Uncharacterized protein n=1 Tax=Paractinoplanes rhizophilus TaxID=1416877 RepID=A0ABW2HQZ2_9ACTN|nr:hypothetical protein [Actinoplanes sp.]
MALGLPISVAIGWTLATPARKPFHVGAPAGTGGLGAGSGSGGIGTAPRRAGSQRLIEVQFSPRPLTPSSVVPPIASAPSAAPSPTTAIPSGSAPIESSASPLPTLIDPPVPTPTEITVTPSASDAPSADPSATPSAGG